MGKEFFKVLDVAQVLDRLAVFQQVDSEPIPLAEAAGRILAEDAHADTDLPGFARSIVDGYAVRAASTFGASESSPALFQLVGSIPMGEAPQLALTGGQAARIATGGMLPPGADSVVMLEHADPLDETNIEVFRSVAPGQNLIAAAEDFEKGARIAARGARMRPQDTGVLAAFGRTKVNVFRRPVVGIISTGDEIVPVDTVPGPAQVRDVNSYTLAALVAEAGALPLTFGIVRDEFDALRAACAIALDRCDMVLLSGGSSVGARDYTIEVISAFAGSEILVHGIAISPGKPTILAQVQHKAFWGLPGHIVSSMIVFSRIVRPFLRHIGGLSHPLAEDVKVPARLNRNVASAQGRTDFIRVRLIRQAEGLLAEPILGKSGLLNTMVKADGIIEVGKNVEGLDEGADVEVILF
jgi:molybdopterin molybdotransferase